jgi:iron complex outermembrane receptor protein
LDSLALGPAGPRPFDIGDIDVDKVPGAVWQTGAQEIQTFNDTIITETLARQAPGVTVGNVSGNDFQPDVSYCGFDATPVTGTRRQGRRLRRRRRGHG